MSQKNEITSLELSLPECYTVIPSQSIFKFNLHHRHLLLKGARSLSFWPKDVFATVLNVLQFSDVVLQCYVHRNYLLLSVATDYGKEINCKLKTLGVPFSSVVIVSRKNFYKTILVYFPYEK